METRKMLKPAPDRTELMKLMHLAQAAFEALSPEEQKVYRREQAISFVYGNLAIDNENITREMVEKAYDEAHG